jgi:hypothetical protein
MSTRVYRRSILFATLLLASIAPRPAGAQDPTDLPLDFLFKGIHEWELQYNQTRLQNDINRGAAAGVNRDLNRISSTIWYDRGGDFGVQRYALSVGVYEFRSSGAGWGLVKLRPMPSSN